MSKRRYFADGERTAIMVDLLREKHPLSTFGPNDAMAPSHVVLHEVAPGTGWSGGSGWADVLVLSCWHSNGYTLTGYEVKASKADLKRELADLSKHQRLARYCDAWWLLAWDDNVLDGQTLPEDWGVMVTEAEDELDVCRALKTRRKAATRTPEEWPRHFVVSLVRNAFEQSPGLAYVERVLKYTRDRAVHDGRQMAENEERRRWEPVVELLYGRDRYGRPLGASDPDKLAAAVAARLGGPSERDQWLKDELRRAKARVDDLERLVGPSGLVVQ